MHPLARALVLGGVIGCWSSPLAAQWPNVVTNLPKTPSGAPNLTAPAPTLADGKTPDLSGGKDDPFARCLPVSVPRGWAAFYLLKVIQTRDAIAILDEYMLQFRQVLTDGRPLPRSAEPLFKGYSVGKWEGDALVVETTGFRDDGWLDLWGHPLTDQGGTTERIRRVNFGTLEVQLIVDDPKAYTQPWTVTRKLALVPTTELLEYVCNENEKSLQHMVGADVK